MSDNDALPTPELDPAPDAAPGGPADAVERDKDDFPIQTPDQPRSAQMEESEVPDEIREPEDTGDADEPDEVPDSSETPV